MRQKQKTACAVMCLWFAFFFLMAACDSGIVARKACHLRIHHQMFSGCSTYTLWFYEYSDYNLQHKL